MSTERFQAMNEKVEKVWNEILDSSKFVRTIRDGKLDKRLYGLYLCETFHYTTHNSRNQALVGVKMPPGNPQYQKFCFEHAAEETGHELMAYHDLISLGLLK